MIKDTDEKVQSLQVQKLKRYRKRYKASIPLQITTLLSPLRVHQPESSLNFTPLGFSWRVHHVGMINY